MHSYLHNAQNMLVWNKDYKEIYDKYNAVADFSSQLDLIERIRVLEYEITKLSRPLTDNEIAYRDLDYSNAMEYDQRASLVLKAFEWKDKDNNRNEVYETIECHQ